MYVYPQPYLKGAIKPMVCFETAWNLVKDQYWLFLGITAMGMILAGAAPLGLLVGPMMCGMYLCFFYRMRGLPVTFDMLFKGLEYFLQSFIVTLIQTVPLIVIIAPFYITFFLKMSKLSSRRGSPEEATRFMQEFLSMLIPIFIVVMVLSIVITLLFTFTFPLIVDRKLNAIDALKLSAQASMSNLGGLIGLTLLNILLSIVGLVLCYIGIFFILPVTLGAVAVAYRQVFPDQTMPIQQPYQTMPMQQPY